MSALSAYFGREVRMIRFEGQTHDLWRNGHPRSRVIRLQAILNWFQEHIRVPEGPTAPSLVAAASEPLRR